MLQSVSLCIVGDEGKEMEIYIPNWTWYDWYTLDRVAHPGYNITVQTPLDYIGVSITAPDPYSIPY
jgi:alpha-glucosidase (family GH31 glycosyl hydrolase)